MDLAARLRSPDSTLAEIAAGLDALDHAGRFAAVQACGVTELGRLYELAADAAPLDSAHFVGNSKPLEPVAHDGWNSLPLPASARRFQKVFCRPESGPERLFGFNEGSARPLIGPGYFVLRPVTEPDWQARGAWVVDYHLLPEGALPPAWPKVVPNWWGLQVVIYNGTRDFMRRVSAHVSVGKPWNFMGSLPFCFALVRQDSAPAS